MHAVDSYLQRNHVSRKLRSLVRSHFRQVFEGSGMTDDTRYGEFLAQGKGLTPGWWNALASWAASRVVVV